MFYSKLLTNLRCFAALTVQKFPLLLLFNFLFIHVKSQNLGTPSVPLTISINTTYNSNVVINNYAELFSMQSR